MIRFIYLIGILTKYSFVALLVKLSWYKRPTQLILKDFFEDAGGSFIKFGQLLALRIDILPKEYSFEILDLLDNVGSFDYKDVEVVFLNELGSKPDEIFQYFEKEPFSSGSFGQVHRAVLKSGEKIAVKVMRPGIEKTVAVDMVVVRTLSFLVDYFFKIPGLSLREFSVEFKRWTYAELDYQKEAENGIKLRKNLEDDLTIIIPKMYLELTTKRILVQEYIDGYRLSQIMRNLRNSSLEYDKMAASGIDIKMVPSVLAQSLLRQYFYFGFFHADLHPGNIIVLPGNRLGLLDFGIVGEWRPEGHEYFREFIRCAGVDDYQRGSFYFAKFLSYNLKQMIQSAMPARISSDQIDEFLMMISNYFVTQTNEIKLQSQAALKERKADYATTFMKYISLWSEYKINVPKEMALFIKVLATMGLVSKTLDNDYSLNNDIIAFFETNQDLPNLTDLGPTHMFKRINRERALEELNAWMTTLIEKEPSVYHLVNSYLRKYNA